MQQYVKLCLCLWALVFVSSNLYAQLPLPSIEAPEKVSRGGKLSYEFRNNTDTHIYLFDPSRISIEKRVNQTWVALQIPYFPCEKQAALPPAVKELGKKEVVKYAWDLREAFCENGKSKYVAVGKGTYRIVAHYGNNPNDNQRMLVHQFKIK